MADPTLRECSPLQCVARERIKQDAKWGEQNHNDLTWLAILAEEFGEVANMLVEDIVKEEHKHEAIQDNLEYELVQVAAVCVAWVECMRRNETEVSNAR